MVEGERVDTGQLLSRRRLGRGPGRCGKNPGLLRPMPFIDPSYPNHGWACALMATGMTGFSRVGHPVWNATRIQGMDKKKLTTAGGAPVVDNQDVLTAGPRGPQLLQDVWFLEKMAHFDREVIPERRMHAKGSGAYGRFTVTHDIRRYTRASLFSEVGKTTDVFVRFSTVAGERGAADAERDIRGFAVKFYTEEGNWDLVGNNTPVFFFRDPLKFPDLNHAVKRDPRTNLRSPTNNWDFWTLLPEAFHQLTILMSDRGIPRGYRHMHGFGSHTFSFINEAKERHWVKFHFRTQQGIENLTDEEAAQIIGQDRESSQRDLYEAIEAGDFPRWTLYVQVMPEADAATVSYHPFDLTKVWPKGDYPLIEVGELELNRNPDNYFAEVEQAAFNPANVVPASASLQTACSRGGCFPTAMPSAIGWRSTTTRSRSTLLAARFTPFIATAPCGWTAIMAARCTTSPTARGSGPSSRSTGSRRWLWREPPTTGTTARTTTITSASPGLCSS